jgi:predicted RNase H-like nuclease (RuvC/YqgF family)
MDNSWCSSDLVFEKKEEEKVVSNVHSVDDKEINELREKIEEMTCVNYKLTDEIKMLKEQSCESREKDERINQLVEEIEELKCKICKISDKSDCLEAENMALKAQNDELNAKVNELSSKAPEES